MKKYNNFILESDENYESQIDDNYKKLSTEVKTFIINNVVTERGLNFSKDTDDQLIKKRIKDNYKEKYKEYLDDIDKIFKSRFEDKSIDDLKLLLKKNDYKIYHNLISNILKFKVSNSNQQSKQMNQPKQQVSNQTSQNTKQVSNHQNQEPKQVSNQNNQKLDNSEDIENTK